jgi:23S rRNA (pseudouridine1915-N3)-methyltransferase
MRALYDDYVGRLPWQVTLREVPETDGPQRSEREGEKLLAAIPDGAHVITLDETGKTMNSRKIAAWIGRQRDEGCRDLAIVIGGADGLTDLIRKRADLVLSFGAMTWPHMMVRTMLAEQLYRAHTILTGHPYHRG